MLAVITVTSPLDNGGGSKLTLREAIEQANVNGVSDTIVFSTIPADGLIGATITLTQGQLNITEDENLTIDGTVDGDGPIQVPLGITIDGGNGLDQVPNTGDGFSVFRVSLASTTAQVVFNGLTITGGDTPSSGGGIQFAVRGNLLVKNSGRNKGDGSHLHAKLTPSPLFSHRSIVHYQFHFFVARANS